MHQFNKFRETKDFCMVKDAGHTFSEEGKAEELYDESLKWIKKFV